MTNPISAADLQAKDGLARLLSSKNLKIIHSPTATTAAWFPTTGAIVLPVFLNMGSAVYNLLIGHEVGHSLHTPDGKEEFSQNDSQNAKSQNEKMGISQIESGLYSKIPKVNQQKIHSYINVIEDTRIERLVVSEYPGLKADFNEGYRWLFNNEFFRGMNMKNLAAEPFINRINLAYKAGHMIDVPFTDKELRIMERIPKLESFQDVCDLVYDIITGYDDTGHFKGKAPPMPPMDEAPKVKDDKSFTDEEDSMNSSSSSPESSTQEDVDSSTQGESESSTQADSNVPGAATNDMARSIRSLIDISNSSTHDVNYPTYQIEKWIVPCQVLIADLRHHVKTLEPTWYTKAQSDAMSMSARFNQMKQAREYQRSYVTKTGRLNPKQLYNYKFTDDIFLKSVEHTEGKSHGIIIIMDWSSSMSDKLDENILNLIRTAIFCRLNSIPFRVLAFTSGYSDDEYNSRSLSPCMRARMDTLQPGDVYPHVTLLEFFNSTMSQQDFRLMCQLLHEYSHDIRRDKTWSQRYQLSGTPLSAAMMLVPSIAQQMKAKWHVELMTAVFITDGGSDDTAFRHSKPKKDEVKRPDQIFNSWYGPGLIVTDSSTHLSWRATHGQTIPTDYRWIINTAKIRCPGLKVVNIYIASCKESIDSRIHSIFMRHGRQKDPRLEITQIAAQLDVSKHKPTKIGADLGLFDTEYLYCMEDKFDEKIDDPEQKQIYIDKSKRGVAELLYSLIDEVAKNV